MKHTDVILNAPPDSLKGHAAKGLFFNGSAQATRMITQFLSVIIMARLLDPADFGLMAMVAPVYAFACLFSDLGLSQSVLQKKHLTHAQINTFFWLNIALTVLTMFFVFAISPLVGIFYNDERTVILTLAIGTLVFIGGLGNQHGILMVRKMAFKAQAIVTISSAVLGLVAAVVCGIFFHSYWALFIGMAVTSITSTLGVWVAVDWRPSRPAWADDTVEMLHYGLGIASGNIITFVVQNITSVVVGRIFGVHMLGIYDRSRKLLAVPIYQIATPVSGVIIPLLYRLHDDDTRYRDTFLRTVITLTFIIAPGVLWATVNASLLITELLGPKWVNAIPIFAILTIAAIPQLINSTAKWLFETQGRGSDYAKWSLCDGVLTVASLSVGVFYGLEGVALARAISLYAQTPFLWLYACRKGPVSIGMVIKALTPHVTGILVSAGALLLFHNPQPAQAWLELFGSLILCYVVCVCVILCFRSGRIALKKDVGFGMYFVKNIILRRQ